MYQGDDDMGSKVEIPYGIPNSYCPEIDDKWMSYSEWRNYYRMAFGLEPPYYANLDGEIWYAYFLSPVDSKLSENKTRIMSAEISQNYESIFINEIYYHLTETKKALEEGWKDIEDELFYTQDKQYIQTLSNDETMIYCGEFQRFKDLLYYLRINFDSTFKEEEAA
tara:strand:- start:12924 stop:13421 length:498 start_codon:yes stop_codon:yes gene_type:complete